jgi:anti-anti-sigma factor
MTSLERLGFEPLGDVVLARLGGQVDLSNAPSVQERLLGAVPNTASMLLLDLSEADYLDSSGVRLIFLLAERLQSRGQKLELVVPDDAAIKRVLVLTEVHRVVPVSDSVAAALRDGSAAD